jgi:hypothetical protein
MPLSLSDTRTLVYNKLNPTEQGLAAGYFGGWQAPLTEREVTDASNFFNLDLPTTMRAVSLFQAAAILYPGQNGFSILSNPTKVTDDAYQTRIVGQNGVSLITISTAELPLDDATKFIFVAVKINTDPENPSALESWASKHPITEPIIVPSHNENEEDLDFDFPFPESIAEPKVIFKDHFIAALPCVLPLPPGHGLPSHTLYNTTEESWLSFIGRLNELSPHYAEWAIAIKNHHRHFGTPSLHTYEKEDKDFDPVRYEPVAKEFFNGLPKEHYCNDVVLLRPIAVNPTEPWMATVLKTLDSERNHNIDLWCAENNDRYQTLVSHLQAIQFTPTTANIGIPPPTSVIMAESKTDQKEKARVAKAKAIIQLFLASPGTNEAGAPIVVPATLDPAFEELLPETPSRATLPLGQMIDSYRHASNNDNNNSLVSNLMLHFPMGIVNNAFATALLNGHFNKYLIAQQGQVIGQQLHLLHFAPTNKGHSDYTNQVNETNAILEEELAHAVPAHRTKASGKLYAGGNVSSHRHILQTLANTLLVFSSLLPQDTPQSPYLFTYLRNYITALLTPDIQTWVETHSRPAHGKHLPYAITVDIHNTTFARLAAFAADSNNIAKVIQGVEILNTPFLGFETLRMQLIAKWSTAAIQDNLSHYSTPPATWISPDTKKEQSRKAPKTSSNASPGSARTPRDSSQQNQTTAPNQPTSTNPTNNTRPTGSSNPDFGLLNAPDSIRHGPTLPTSGKRLCMPFAVRGRSCRNSSYTCSEAHVTTNNGSLPDYQAIDMWVNNTPNVTWTRIPARLASATPHPTTTTPPANPPVARVTPPAPTTSGPTNQG